MSEFKPSISFWSLSCTWETCAFEFDGTIDLLVSSKIDATIAKCNGVYQFGINWDQTLTAESDELILLYMILLKWKL